VNDIYYTSRDFTSDVYDTVIDASKTVVKTADEVEDYA
jgi:hypothetical protein